ncbi:hypothetical protein STEG23_003150, partial [Scotinomys teguina]
LTYMCRAGAIRTDDSCIVLKTLPCLVRMCSKERLLEERVEGAETLAYLIEPDVELQRIASITDHLIAMLADYFKYPSSVSAITDIKRLDHDLKHAHELRQAAFKLYASLGANDEDIRKKIIETENMMDRIVTGLSESSVKVRLAAVRCLHSLSRSVQQLRTSFQDHAVWKPLMKVLQNAPDEILVVASSMLCNLLLEFSPSKEPILESGAVELLCGLTQSENPALRVNGIWALMNMAFQAEQKIKADILRSLSTEQLFRLLSDSDLNVLMKTLGLLRNLLSTRPHIDKIMSTHGKQIMQAVTLILEGEHSIEVKEQTLCILANIADGTTAKELIMTNDDILQKIKYYMGHSHVKLQLAAMFCISNLIWNEEEGSQERQDKLRDMGIVDILHKLSQSPDSNLCDKDTQVFPTSIMWCSLNLNLPTALCKASLEIEIWGYLPQNMRTEKGCDEVTEVQHTVMREPRTDPEVYHGVYIRGRRTEAKEGLDPLGGDLRPESQLLSLAKLDALAPGDYKVQL